MDNNLEKYKNELLSLLGKSSDYFEKQLNYISAGAIGASMVIVEKFVKDVHLSSCKVLLVLSWISFTLTLVGNLVSHIYTFKAHSLTIEEIDSHKYDYVIARRRNNIIKIWNFLSALILIIGIVFLIIYLSLNI